jgi:hypothetical protein
MEAPTPPMNHEEEAAKEVWRTLEMDLGDALNAFGEKAFPVLQRHLQALPNDAHREALIKLALEKIPGLVTDKIAKAK